MWIVFYCSNLIRSNIFLLFWLFIEIYVRCIEKACDFVLLWFQPVRTVITAPTVNRNVSVNGGNAIASEDVCAQTDMEPAVRNQVKKKKKQTFHFKESVVCFWEMSGLNPFLLVISQTWNLLSWVVWETSSSTQAPRTLSTALRQASPLLYTVK